MGAIKADFPTWECRIIGEGPERPKLEALIGELGLAGIVELCGKRPHSQVLGEMSWCDVFALASWGEADGTVYGEAMQFGKPVIACADEGIAEVVRDGEHGRLVPARDAAAIADALAWLLEDSARRERIGAKRASSPPRMRGYPMLAASLIDLYAGLLQSGRRVSH